MNPWKIVLAALTLIARGDDLEKTFREPPDSARPGVLWMWMGCNVTKEGITRDLEALKAAGFGRTTVFSLADVTTPWAGEIGKTPTPEIISWEEPWWKLVRHAAEESKRLGMDFGMFNGPSYESSGGKWITPELSMQQICFSETRAEGGKHFSGSLAKPEVDPRAVEAFPVFNPNTGKVEKPEIPERKTFYRDVAVLAMPADGVVAKDQIIDLSAKLGADGKLECDLPAGKWTIYRFGHTTMGTLIQPAQWKATGFECDKMSLEAVTFHMNHVIGEIQKHLGDLIGTGFTHVHFDSYEAGKPGWTPKMREEFAKRRGYVMTPFLATFAKRTVGSDQETRKFHGDFDATIMDLFNEVYYATIQRMLHEAKLDFLCEPYGGPWRQDEIMPKVDRVMTEFWTHGGKYSPYAVDSTIAALRKSGQNLVEAEAFTGSPGDSHWNETPAWLKPIGDAAFCAGINRFVLHRFPQQPWDDRYKPGQTMGQWGTHFDRTQTWWEPGKALFRYWHRCQAMLLWGKIANADGDFRVIAPRGGVKLRAIHRSDGTADVFFVANTERAAGAAKCSFAISGRQSELWDPVTGAMRNLPEFEMKDGRTIIPLRFDKAQSFFIVFRKPLAPMVGETAAKNFPKRDLMREITGDWSVTFDPKWGGPNKPATFATLEDWTKRAESGIKYFSGTAVYRKTFDCDAGKIPSSLILDLGVVHCIARVKLNGTDLGVIWCAPWGVEVPREMLKISGNELEIEITNIWANRLIGDEQEPPDCEWLPGHMGNGGFLKEFPDWFLKGEPRPSKGRFCFTTWNYFTKDSPLVPSGLIGPVRLMSQDWTQSPDEDFAAAPRGPGKTLSAKDSPVMINAWQSDESSAAFETDILTNGLIPIAKVVEENVAHEGGGSNDDAIHNGTTQNGSGGDDTANEGKTFRGYAKGSTLTFSFDLSKNKSGYDVSAIQSFSGHNDGRASQNYSVLVAHASDPTKFVKLCDVALNFKGRSTEISIVPKKAGPPAAGVAAIRFEFHDGPLGFNVYREFRIAGTSGR